MCLSDCSAKAVLPEPKSRFEHAQRLGVIGIRSTNQEVQESVKHMYWLTCRCTPLLTWGQSVTISSAVRVTPARHLAVAPQVKDAEDDAAQAGDVQRQLADVAPQGVSKVVDAMPQPASRQAAGHAQLQRRRGTLRICLAVSHESLLLRYPVVQGSAQTHDCARPTAVQQRRRAGQCSQRGRPCRHL